MARIAALVLFDSDDAEWETFANNNDGPALREKVMAALPSVDRVVAVMPEEDARLMIDAWMMAGDILAGPGKPH